jgi:hypothetical protein
LFDRLAQLYRLFSQAVPLGEAAQFGQTPGHHAPDGYSGQGGLAKARQTPLAGKQPERRPADVQRLPIVPYVIVCRAQVRLGKDLDVDGTTGRGQGESPLARCNGTVMLGQV